MANLLKITNLHAVVENKEILKGINLEVNKGEIHAIMGPNGSGKSTLASVLAGNPKFEVTRGSVTFNGKELLDMDPADRAKEGIFLSFQYPIEIPGVSMVNFMRAALNEQRKYRGEEQISASNFLKLMRDKRELLGIDSQLVSRSVNEGFSGGRRSVTKFSRWRCLILPWLSSMNRSGLDIDALRIVASGVNALHRPRRLRL